MNDVCDVKIQRHTLDAAQALAAETHLPVEQIVDEAVQRGISTIRQNIYFDQRIKRAKEGSFDEVMKMFSPKRNGNAPDPGDELPEDLKYLLDVRR
jgi:hypothetical protein